MGKKGAAKDGKAAAKAAKKAKAAAKSDKRVDKTTKKSKGKGKAGKPGDDSSDDDQDLDAILERIKREWEEAHTVSETLATGPPSRRANATLTPCPTGQFLWMIGGEYFSEDNKAYFYADVFRYTPEKNEWRLFTSPTRPNPRSAHAVAASGKGMLFLFGGEFSSLHQNNFHHYRDFWSFDVTTHMWERIETKVKPGARSGHRMAFWKHLLVLFGGFNDPGGPKTHYLADTWVFDTQEYKWTQVCMGPTQQSPPARSGFSFMAMPDGVVLHGGYCKDYTKGKKVQGTALDDTWFLKMDADLKLIKWQRMKPKGQAPHPPSRSGCTGVVWGVTGKAVLFGGVTDVMQDEESIDSVFYQDLWALHLTAPGRWQSMALRKPKKKPGAQAGLKKAKKKQEEEERKKREREERERERREREAEERALEQEEQEDYDDDEGEDGDDEDGETERVVTKTQTSAPTRAAPKTVPDAASTAASSSSVIDTTVAPTPEPQLDSDDPQLTIPIPRYNAMLSILRNTLYIYGGIIERGAREYTLDDFHSLNLEKLERFECLKPCDVEFGIGEESSDEEDGEDGEDDEEEEDTDDEEMATTVRDDETLVADDDATEEVEDEKTDPEKAALRSKAEAFLGGSRDAARSAEDALSTPLPGESLAQFYARSRSYWAERAFASGASDQRGKMLRRDGFSMAQERYAEYKPLLEEVEKILREAGLDEEEMKRSAASGGAGASGASRGRR